MTDMITTQDRALAFAKSLIMKTKDWQEVQHALADHDEFRTWLEETYGDDVLGGVQSIIRKAEEQLGDKLPVGYS